MQFVRRQGLLLLGWCLLGLGTLGLFLPLVPTTCFWLGAAWAFSKSSKRWHSYLLNHREFGPILKEWRESGTISKRVKRLAIGAMTISFGLSILAVQEIVWLQFALFSGYVALATYIATRPSPSTPVARERAYGLAE